MSRCSQIDTSFPFLLAGWSVGVMVRAGGSASRIIGDRGATDPGGGKRVLGGRKLAWQQLVGGARGYPWTPDVQAFPALGSHSSTNAGQRELRFRLTMGMWWNCEVADLDSGDGLSDAGDTACRSGQVVATETGSGLVGCEGECCREASVGGGTGVFSRAGTMARSVICSGGGCVHLCTFMQTEVVFLGHIVGRAGLVCDPAKLSAFRTGMRRIRLKVYNSLLALSDITGNL